MKRNSFITSFIVTGISFYFVGLIAPGIKFDNTLSIIIAALIFAFVNALIRPVFVFLSLPLLFITLGLFIFVINGLMLEIVSLIVPWFHVASLWDAVFASIVLSIINLIIKGVFIGNRV
jgi:putative membrane protein